MNLQRCIVSTAPLHPQHPSSLSQLTSASCPISWSHMYPLITWNFDMELRVWRRGYLQAMQHVRNSLSHVANSTALGGARSGMWRQGYNAGPCRISNRALLVANIRRFDLREATVVFGMCSGRHWVLNRCAEPRDRDRSTGCLDLSLGRATRILRNLVVLVRKGFAVLHLMPRPIILPWAIVSQVG